MYSGLGDAELCLKLLGLNVVHCKIQYPFLASVGAMETHYGCTSLSASSPSPQRATTLDADVSSIICGEVPCDAQSRIDDVQEGYVGRRNSRRGRCSKGSLLGVVMLLVIPYPCSYPWYVRGSGI
jgi:hypothetical protein